MPDLNPDSNISSSVSKPWYKTVGGIITLVVLGIILLLILLFTGFFTYYAWQFKYGDTKELGQKFSKPLFSVDQTLLKKNEKTSVIVEDFQKYIRQSNPTKGSSEAPVTIIAFIDFDCSSSHDAYPVFKELIEEYEPVVRVVFKHLPLISIHKNADILASAAACAHEQGKFWEYYDILFTKDIDNEEAVYAYSEGIGLDQDKFSSCIVNREQEGAIQQDVLDAIDMGLRGTPTYIVNGYKLEGAVDSETWEKLILANMQK